MIALDTNVLVRLLTCDHEEQAMRVKALIDSHEGEDGIFFVSDVVISELSWTLERSYQYSRSEIEVAISALSVNRSFSFESSPALEEALEIFRTVEAGFPDCLIVAKAHSRGCSKTVTFDGKMADLPGVECL